MKTVALTLYKRRVCPLCDDLLAVLEGMPFAVTAIEIDGRKELEERYGRSVPVLLGPGGKVLVKGRLDGGGLRRLRALLGGGAI